MFRINQLVCFSHQKAFYYINQIVCIETLMTINSILRYSYNGISKKQSLTVTPVRQ